MNTPAKLFVLTLSVALFSALPAQADITTGLVGWWPLGDGPTNNTAGDYSGNGNTGTLTNFADHTYSNMWTTITDPTNMDAYAMQFNTNGHAGNTTFGTNTYVIVPDSTSLDLPSANRTWTLSAWVYPTVAPSSEPPNATIICKGIAGGVDAYSLYMSGGNFVTMLRNAAGSGSTTASSTNALAVDTWYNVTAVIQEPKPSGSQEIILYLNGVNDCATNSNTYTTVWTTNAPVTIGCGMAANGLVTNAFVGIIDQVRIYDRALAASDVLQLYTNSASQLPPVIVQQPVSATVDQGAAFTNSVLVYSSSTPGYQWYTNGVAVAGATNTQFIINPAEPSWNGASYYVVATNIYGAATSSVVQLTVETTLPTFVNQFPITYTNVLGTNLLVLYSGANPAFSVSTLSATPVTYFWFTNGALVGGVNATNFSLTNVQTGSFNCYCVASNSAATATSAVWSASVIADPTNSTGGLAPYPQAVLALNPIGYWRLNDTNVDGPDNGDGDNGYVCHDYVGGNDGVYSNIVLGNLGYNPTADPSDTSALFGDDPDHNQSDGGDEDANSIYGINFGSPAGTSKAFTISAWVSGTEGQISSAGIVTLGWGNGGEQFNLDCGAANSAFRFFMRDAAGNTHGVSSTTVANTVASPLFGPWYHLVGVVDEVTNQTVTFYINGVSVGSSVVTNGSGVLASSYPMSIGARMSSQTTNFNYQFFGYINDVTVFNYALSSNQVANEYASGGDTPPFFTQPPPANETLVAGTTLTIPATAWGTGPLTNQWYDVNGNPIATAYGTTNGNSINATLVYSNVPGSWNGQQVNLNVSNEYGSTNFAVTLTVLTAPIFTTNIPSQITLLEGQSYTYVSGTTGVLPIDYQWYANGTGLANQTNTTYSLTASSPGTFTYYVIATNSLGAATSVVSTLTVLPPPTSAYATNILNLNPVGYWPMHEIESPAHGDIETNYGSLGLLGTGYYADWVGQQGIIHGWSGALANDPDTAVYFKYTGGGDTGTTTNCLLIPVNSTNAVLNPPFSVECWFWPTNNNQGDIWAQSGFEGLNSGGEGGGGGSVCGIRLYWGGNFSIYTYDNSSTLYGPESGSYSAGQWYHIVLTCDANTNMTLYVDGQVAISSTNLTGKYSPDYWDPISIATGRGYSRDVPGGIDEFAVYTTNLQATDIQQHYTDGTGEGQAGVYVADVTNDNPVIYLRMDSAAYTPPPPSTWPVLLNYASSGANGVYTPGTMPGIMAGPVHPNGLPINSLTGTNVAPLSGVSSFADAGYAAAYNPVGKNAFSITAMFRGNPCDGRFQDIVGHSDLSWRIAMNSNGHLQCNFGQDPSNVVNSAGLYNDGKWHVLTDVYQPASTANITGTNLLYVDGALDTTATGISTNGIYPGTNLDVMIGAAPDYTNNPGGLGRQFDGQICEVALFNTALTPAQLQALYYAIGVGPVISQQPVAATNVFQNSTLTVPAVANGTAPLSYQWFDENANNYIPGQTNATLVISNIQASDTYYLTVTNLYGSTNSSPVAVNVISGLNVSLGPPSVSLYVGASAALTAQASGTVPFGYQWYQNGSPIANATNASYTATATLSSTAYTCTVTNDYNGYSSTNAGPVTVIGIAAPTTLYQLTVLSNNPIAYWRLNEGPDNGSGNDGTIAYDYVGGHNGDYTNVELGLAGFGLADSTDTAALFGIFNSSPSNSYVSEINNSAGGFSPVNFAKPAGSNGEFSVEAWVCSSNAQVSGAGIVTKGYGNGGEQFNLDVYNGFRFFIRDASGATHGSSALPTAPAIGQWYYVVGVFDGANGIVHLYTNGVDALDTTNIAVGLGVLTATSTNTLMQQATMVSIGARTSSEAVTNYDSQFQGKIQDVALYNYALSAAQVAAHYQASGLAVPPVNSSPTNLVFAVTNNVLYLTWPTDHIGWQLQAQTNTVSVGLSTNWANYNPSSGPSSATNQVAIPINLTNGTVFYRLIYTP